MYLMMLGQNVTGNWITGTQLEHCTKVPNSLGSYLVFFWIYSFSIIVEGLLELQ